MPVNDNGNEVLRKSAIVDDVNGGYVLKIFQSLGTSINPLAKFVEATYTNSDQTVTYNFYESSSKATLYNTIITEFSEPQDTSFTSAEWL